MVLNVQCALALHSAAVPQRPVGINGVFLTGRLGVSAIRQPSGLNYMVKYYPSGCFSIFNVCHVPHIDVKYSHSSVAVGSNGVFLNGRSGVSRIIHVSREDYLSQNNTSGPPNVVFNV